jgi:hypothetical protein
MADETKVRVKLDTRQAKTELRGFVRESAAAAGRVAGGVKRAIGRGLGVVGLGAGIGTGLAAVRGATESGFGDVVGEAFGGVGAELAETLFGSLDEEARATRAAREETIQAFGAIAGRAGEIPPGARNFFEQVRSLRVEEERGREMFQRDERFRGPGVGQLVDRIMEGIGTLISQAVDALAEKLNPFK